MGIISWIIWGLIVGAVARLLLPGRQSIGLLWTIALGVLGALIGGFIATGLLGIADYDDFDLGSFLIAVLTSVVLLGVAERTGIAGRG
ncbi:MAG: GlsB/YeaQ/YmgE family stress response membrane protein [Thermoleophilum sp.]|nr:GlsB/YeaQ/YmgE family stress response membrane protein [Thermoleophilum sp.]